MTIDKPRHLTPEEIFAQAVSQNGKNLTEGDMRLLTKGLRFLQEHQAKRVNEIELTSIKGLIAYVSYTQEVSQETVIAILTAQYGVDKPENILARHYNNAIEYLVDLEMKKVVN